MKVDIIKEETPFDEFYTIYKAELRFELFDGTMSEKVTRYSFEKNDAVAVLIYHTTKDAYILVRQFRYPPFHQEADPWMTEIVAGGLEENESEEAAARREVEEETGYTAKNIQRLYKYYVSPGLMSERVTIFVAEVDENTKTGNGGGAAGEDEDIELVWIPRKNALQWLEQQEVGDAKTIIAIQWHLQNNN